MDRIAITGFGAVSPLGTDAPSTWEALREGRSGVSLLEADWASDLPTQIAGTVPDSFAESLAVRETKRLDRCEQFTLVAGREAWEMAGRPDVEGDRLGVVVGTGIGGITTTIAQQHVLEDSGHRRVSPHTVTMLMGNGPAAWLSIDLGARAGARTPTSACASGAEAIAIGREMILANSADIVVAGGSEAAITGLTLAAFGQIRALSKRNADPERASRPFDAERDGFVLGEGAALLVLERESHAVARGAEIFAFLDGAAVTSDAFDIVGADPSNQARTMNLALRAADLAPGDIDFVHAHATSTPTGDLNEADALAETGIHCPVTSSKSMTGHLLGASGSLSAIASVMALREGMVSPTINVEQLDPAIKLDVVSNVKREVDARAAIVNSFGFGGHNAALVLSRV